MKTKVVYKYPVALVDEFAFEASVGAVPLTVQVQRGEPFVWLLVDPEAKKEIKRFRLAGTGHPIENADSWIYVGSFQLHGGALVFHLFMWP